MENQLHAAGYGIGNAGNASLSDLVEGPTTMTTERTPSRVPPAACNSGDGPPPRARSIVPRSGTLFNSGGAPNAAKRARKDRGPNWSLPEITALVNAKRELFLEELDTIDGRDLMNPDATKWIRISIEVMRAGFSPCPRDGPACKSKWNQIIPEYKRIADFFTRSGTNGIDYWNMTTAERKNEGLPRSFSQEIFNNINEWFGNRPSMQPPHTRDLLSNEDSNYTAPSRHADGGNKLCNSEGEQDDSIDIAEPVELSDDTGIRLSSPVAPTSNGIRTAENSFSSPTASPTSFQRNGIPPGVTPFIVSSSDKSAFTMRRREGNTAVRRKHLSGHNVIAAATKASGDVMAGQMKNMADTSHEIERSKIQVQLKLFTEQMDYQRERDRRLHENARLANMNARLAIEKQGQVVQCLSDLSNVLSAGLRLPKTVHSGLEEENLPPKSDNDDKVAATDTAHVPPTQIPGTADIGAPDGSSLPPV